MCEQIVRWQVVSERFGEDKLCVDKLRGSDLVKTSCV